MNTNSIRKKIAQKLCSLFQYGVLETKVCEFIFLRAKYNAEKNNFDFAQYEYQHRTIPSILGYMSHNEVYRNVLSKDSFLNPVQIITNILTCTVQLYRHVYEAYLQPSDYITWIAGALQNNSILNTVFKSVFCQVPVTPASNYMITLGSRGYFNNMYFKSSDLRNIGFQHSKITDSVFADAILCGCDFSDAVLDRSDFANADIHYASLKNASLENCNMIGTDLRGTTLPDGFESFEQNEQIEHLRSLQINGLTI